MMQQQAGACAKNVVCADNEVYYYKTMTTFHGYSSQKVDNVKNAEITTPLFKVI